MHGIFIAMFFLIFFSNIFTNMVLRLQILIPLDLLLIFHYAIEKVSSS